MTYRNEKGQMECPACSAKNPHRTARPEANMAMLYACRQCGALFGGNIYLGESYAIVKPFWCRCTAGADTCGMIETRYFDLTALSSKGVVRRHGWFHEACGCLTQVG